MHLLAFVTQKPESILKFKKVASLSNHLNEFQGILDQMSEMNIKFEDEILKLLLLNSLLESWETFMGSVLNEEMRRKAQGSSSRFEKEENKDKNDKSKEKDYDDDDDLVTTATSDDLVILRDFESINLVSMWFVTLRTMAAWSGPFGCLW
ncbi:hypothetical protein CR513_35196, partial [Mucuna pruriens]